MDCRIDPLEIFGFEVGDIHVMRNAGARITPDMIRPLILALSVAGVGASGITAAVLTSAAQARQPRSVEYFVAHDAEPEPGLLPRNSPCATAGGVSSEPAVFRGKLRLSKRWNPRSKRSATF